MLNDRHLKAIDLLVAGRRGKDIEQLVPISHAQLGRLKHDPEFIARWEEERALQHQERVEKLWNLFEPSVDVLEKDLEEGDPKAAEFVLKLLGPGLIDMRRVSTMPPDGSTSDALPQHVALPQLEASSSLHLCEKCGREFKSAGGLGRHRETHSPVAPRRGSSQGKGNKKKRLK